MKYLGGGSRSQPPLDGAPDQCWRVAAVERVDGDDPGGRCDIDLRQPLAADHIDSDEQQPALPELWSKRGADFLLARRELGLRRGAANRKIGADFAFAGNAVDPTGDFAVDEHDALVAGGDLGEEFLDDVRFAIGLVEQLHQRGEIAAVRTDAEDRSAGKAVQRLDDDLA